MAFPTFTFCDTTELNKDKRRSSQTLEPPDLDELGAPAPAPPAAARGSVVRPAAPTAEEWGVAPPQVRPNKTQSLSS